MDLTFSAEQQALIDAVRRCAQEQITPERLQAWEQLPAGVDAEFRRVAADLGWLGLGVPPSAGGSGGGLVDVACLMSECSRGLIPGAVGWAIRSTYALAQLDPAAPELAGAVRGEIGLALALDDAPRGAVRVEGDGGAARVTGEARYVPLGDSADRIIVAAHEGSGTSVVLVDAGATHRTRLRSVVSHEPQAQVRFERAAVARRLTPPGGGDAAAHRARRHQLALALAEMVGGMDAVLERTVAYVKEREQFGQKIAVFQAVQHQVADMATAHTAARHLAWQAITRIAEERDQAIDVPAAAAFVGQAFKRLTLTAHHLHGGAGYVVEHPLHYYSERAQSLCIRFTPEARALEEVAAALLD